MDNAEHSALRRGWWESKRIAYKTCLRTSIVYRREPTAVKGAAKDPDSADLRIQLRCSGAVLERGLAPCASQADSSGGQACCNCLRSDKSPAV